MATLSSPPEVEARLAQVPRAAEGQPVSYAELPPESLARLRGVTGLSESAPGTPMSGSRLTALAADLARRASRDRSLWLKRIELENPAR